MIAIQSVRQSGVTLNILPPNCTMMICPIKMTSTMIPNPLQSLKWNVLLPVANARAYHQITEFIERELYDEFAISFIDIHVEPYQF